MKSLGHPRKVFIVGWKKIVKFFFRVWWLEFSCNMKALTRNAFFSEAPNQHLKTLAPTLQIDFINFLHCFCHSVENSSGWYGEQIFHTSRAYSLCVCVCVCFSLQSLNWRMVGMSILRSPTSEMQCNYHHSGGTILWF